MLLEDDLPAVLVPMQPAPVVAHASDEAAERTMTPREQLQVKQAMMIDKQAAMIDKQAKMIEKQAGIIGRLGPLPWTIGEVTAPLQKRPAWCAKRRTPCQEVQLRATDVAAEMTTSLHQLETRAERP